MRIMIQCVLIANSEDEMAELLGKVEIVNKGATGLVLNRVKCYLTIRQKILPRPRSKPSAI